MEKCLLDALHDARGLLTYHVQSKPERDPAKTLDELRSILESTAVTKVLNTLRDESTKKE